MMLRVRSMDALGEWTGGGESARDDSGMSWYGAKLAAIMVLVADSVVYNTPGACRSVSWGIEGLVEEIGLTQRKVQPGL